MVHYTVCRPKIELQNGNHCQLCKTEGMTLLKTYHDGNSEVSFVHLLAQPIDFPPGVAEDDGLCDGQCLVQVTQGVELPLLQE